MSEIVTFGAEGILTKVASLAQQEFNLLRGFKGELTSLRESLSKVQAMLQDAGKKKDQAEAVKMWVKDLEDVAHDADDVLDEYEYEVLRRKVEVQDQMKKKVLNFFSLHYNPIAFRHKMAHKIKKINSSLVNLKNEAAGIGLVASSTFQGGSSHDAGVDRETVSSFAQDEKYIVGREKVVLEIVTTLINSSNTQKNSLSVMPIVGFAGLGKTTLAKSIYNHDEIGRQFTIKIWICVSIPFEVKSILNKILVHFKLEKAQEKEAALKNLQEHLKGKRYLLVLDDVWNEDPDKWNDLTSCLSSVKDTQGSSILVTTRSEKVAKIVQTLPMCNLGKLSDDQCWLILKNRAFLDDSAPLTKDQERIGRDIARKCAGLPLLAKVLGNMMRFENIDGWRVIQESTRWDLSDGDERIMSILKLSFDELKPTLKQCFAYCSMFVKDFNIEKDDLVQLWMAQGLLHRPSSQSNLEMEDVGNQYFNILLEKSFFQDVSMDNYNVITHCKMHDLVHDLSELVSKSKSKDSNDVRHMAQPSASELQGIPKGIVVRSMFLEGKVLGNILPRFKGLRVLKLQEAYITELPISIGKLKHLRYLDISGTSVERLPQSVGKLYNLQTLRIWSLWLQECPKELQNLINLRHIYFGREHLYPIGMGRLSDIHFLGEDDVKYPVGMGRLSNLRSLSHFIVGKEKGRGIEELGGLKYLKGKISLYHLERVRDIEEAKKAKLAEKTNIHQLKFQWGNDRSSAINNDRDVLEGLEPHSELRILKICNFSSDQFPSWMMSGNLFSSLKKLRIVNAENLIEWTGAAIFPRLEELFLMNCNQLKSAPTHFPCLQKLTIDSMDSGMPIANISTQLTTLTHLTIKYMKELASLPEGMLKNNKNLSYLEIVNCPDLTCIAADVFGCCASLESLRISECPNLTTLPDGLHTLLSLKKLSIIYCQSLECIPVTQGVASLCKFPIFKCLELCILPEGLEYYNSLQMLTIRGCSKITSIPITHGLPSLRELEISYCGELSSLPSGLQHCTSLEHFSIINCPNLEAIPSLDSLTQLRQLYIYNCGGLKDVHPNAFAASLTRLKELEIGGFWKELDSFPAFQVFPQLEILALHGWPKLKSLPEQVQHFTSLISLSIWFFDGMEALPEWLGNLASLESLSILRCKNLMYLPTLEAMKCLTELQSIEFYSCPLLKERCNKDNGPEWPKISHIAYSSF
ncbi:PREDICTED: putative disease resistance protein RGA3 [Prunus mume]|uniref:Disease resistance protein RGA3 n=1 Tax=Prunus mume TaxID=102107 RepID=A0ABM0PQB3_PRUMU|nr:PREDICTED: putative disease resistance protein RGA3 [Prunus mume]